MLKEGEPPIPAEQKESPNTCQSRSRIEKINFKCSSSYFLKLVWLEPEEAAI